MVAKLTAEEILYATTSRLKSGFIDDQRGRIVWNVDELIPGDWFIAIPSEHYDPHDELSLAMERGARGCIVSRRGRYASASRDATLISVPDTKTALLDIVRYWRHRVNPRVVAVTGSIGRRATSLLLNQLVSLEYRTHTVFEDLGGFGSIQEILSMPMDTEVLIVETAAMRRGDMTRIGGALDPDVAVLTQILHPLPSPERDAQSAAIYCELLETLSDVTAHRIGAVVYDNSPSVKRRADEVLEGIPAIRHSSSVRGIEERLSKLALQELSEAILNTIGQPVSKADVWCAVEAAKILGIADVQIDQIFGLIGNELSSAPAIKH